jgi:hypothetical protein
MISTNKDHWDRFKFESIKQIGRYVVVCVHYSSPSARYYGGRKVMIFEATIEQIANRDAIDPHFNETNYQPLARFPADAQGKANAEYFAGMLNTCRS